MVVCNHCVTLTSQLTLANACRTFRAHLSTAILRKIGSLEAYGIREWKFLKVTPAVETNICIETYNIFLICVTDSAGVCLLTQCPTEVMSIIV